MCQHNLFRLFMQVRKDPTTGQSVKKKSSLRSNIRESFFTPNKQGHM